ncbi:MAG: hypothetical protein ISR99_01160 [Parcubacteria group bacterium]|nr:hypothetical protein [Parcubacteria group bacterium]
MEPKFKTSFIPKQPISGTPSKKRSGGLGIISLILSIFTIGIIALAVGVFLYQQLLDTSVERKKATLDRAQAAFEPTLIQELVRVDNRLKAAEEILDNHVSISALFDLLERLTLNSVRFESFEYAFLEDSRINISMSGNAKNFSGVALQADIFGRDRLINEPIFSGLNLDQTGNVIFDFTATIDKDLVSYVNNLSSFTGREGENIEPLGEVELDETSIDITP